jgi:uncharacterized protein with PQ loop repeat
LIVSTVLSVLLGLSVRNNFVWLILGISVSITSIGLVTYSKNPFSWIVLVWILLSLVVVLLLFVFGKLIQKKMSKSKSGDFV